MDMDTIKPSWKTNVPMIPCSINKIRLNQTATLKKKNLNLLNKIKLYDLIFFNYSHKIWAPVHFGDTFCIVFSDHEFIPTSVESLVDLVAENGDEYEDKLRLRKIDMHSSLW